MILNFFKSTMKRTICLILSLTSILIGFGQSLSLKGRIVDRGNNPVADAYFMVFSRRYKPFGFVFY